jgi:hypothetical protein
VQNSYLGNEKGPIKPQNVQLPEQNQGVEKQFHGAASNLSEQQSLQAKGLHAFGSENLVFMNSGKRD